MKKFAKLFETEKFGQILVVLNYIDTEEQEYEVRFSVQPPDLGICSSALMFEGTDEGEAKANAAFDSVTEESAVAMVRHLFSLVAR